MIKDVENFDVITNDQERQTRLALCNACEKQTIRSGAPICDQCACPIEYVISYRFKICPLEKWNV